jgi:hypothetical protein
MRVRTRTDEYNMCAVRVVHVMILFKIGVHALD